jgi:hypothetical protein
MTLQLITSSTHADETAGLVTGAEQDWIKCPGTPHFLHT